MHKIAVTGGSGFIGSAVVDALRQAGHEVVNLDMNKGDYLVDIREEREVSSVLSEVRPEFVFHIAAIADARRAMKDPVEAASMNVTGTASVLKATHGVGVPRFVLASTCWVANAMGPGLLDEQSWLMPSGGGHPYTTYKIASEMLCHDYRSLFGQDFTILRYGIPYGPGMWPGLVLRNWLAQALYGKPIVIYGDGSATRRFVYVDDLAQAHVLALQDAASGQTYNLEGMRAVSIRELAETFQDVWREEIEHCPTNKNLGDVEIEYKEEPSRAGEVKFDLKLMSNNKAYVDLGWEPETDLSKGVRKVIAWYLYEYCVKGES